MSGDAASFVGNIPGHYDRDLGPMIFVDYAADMARRVAAFEPMRVLETAAGTGIVTRWLRDLLPSGSQITATDFNPPMLEVAHARLEPGEVDSSLRTPRPFRSGTVPSMLSCVNLG